MHVGVGPVLRRVVVVKLQVCVVDIHGVGSGKVDVTEARTLELAVSKGNISNGVGSQVLRCA